MLRSARALLMSAAAQTFIDDVNTKYASHHVAYEDNFWATKMALAGNSTEKLTETKNTYDAFLQDRTSLTAVREHLKDTALSEVQRKTLVCFEKTFLCYIMESPEAAKTKEAATALEDALGARRNTMKLGYNDPTAEGAPFVAASSVALRTKMVTAADEATRKACWDGMMAVPQFVAKDFAEIAKLRNAYSKANGFADYYEYKIQTTEGFSKARLFEILDDLEASTRPLVETANARLAKEKGADAVKPWNRGYAIAGAVTKEIDPYFPFEGAVSAWARSFAALGIEYRKSDMNLDLCDRQGKYSNGFCHWPQCPYVKADGTEVPCVTNFTSLATPSAVGSGYTALTTLMHEGGHAAHFANIVQPSPLFAQERAPMSVAYAENQSMVLDSLVDDAAWLGRYAVSRDGETIPWALVEKKLRQSHPYGVYQLRGMLAVPYFEKAVYELSDEELTEEKVLALSAEVSARLNGGVESRPVLCVPHVLADESSCYYQGYILAEMSVHQTRAYLLGKYGSLTDNPAMGKAMTETYWRPGNSEGFLDLVEKLTGKPLTAADWVRELGEDIEAKVVSEKADYEKAVAAGPKYAHGDNAAFSQLNMRVRLVHGDEVVADTQKSTFSECCATYEKWITKTFPAEEKK